MNVYKVSLGDSELIQIQDNAVTRGVHLPEAVMHSPVSDSPLFPKIFQTPWKIFSKKIDFSIFIRQNF